MAELNTLARPYAKAAFEYAYANKDLANWAAMLQLLAQVAKVDVVLKALQTPSLTSKQQAQVIIDICGQDIDVKVQNFVKALAENKRLILLSEIAELFIAFKAEVEKTVDVDVTSAFPLDSASEEKLAKSLAKKLNCEVKVKTSVDKSLIGGIVIRAGDMIIDGSIRGRLTKLAEAMNS